jgi:NADH dehydrogenase/NADH:ubiquinone oxidoreductase subunit G
MADKVQANDPLSGIANLLALLGGNKQTTTSNAGDVSSLDAVLRQLQGSDYQGMLQAIFQQASGQIPGLQTAFGNAMGARSGGNSAVAAALQQLLKQTTVAAQDNIAKQQLANQQTQVQAAQAKAAATKGTSQTSKSGVDMQKAAGMLALLQAATKLTGSNTVQDMAGKVATGLGISGGSSTTGSSAPAPVVDMPFPQAGNMTDSSSYDAIMNAFSSPSTASPVPEMPFNFDVAPIDPGSDYYLYENLA